MQIITKLLSAMANAQAMLFYGALAFIFVAIFTFTFSDIHQVLRRHRGRPAGDRGVILNQSPGHQPQQSEDESLVLYKELYFKLHNLEDYPEILPQARNILIALLSRALLFMSTSGEPGILSCGEYTPNTLRNFLQHQQDEMSRRWEQYVLQRKHGCPRKMFKDREDAIHWLKQMAPLKYVDGAWLGHINNVTAPFSIHSVVKNAWQILSEEYGDGDLKKHHVYIYNKLMRGLVPGLPRADTVSFIEPGHGLTDTSTWRSAVAQLLISLFPHEFFPEILGFNVHFESIKLETLIVAKELRELNIDPYYFNLHTSIDNADSGHTAMAIHAANQYLEQIRSTHGVQEQRRAWKRVQIGFVLSGYLEQKSASPDIPQPAGGSLGMTDVEERFINIIRAKSAASQKIHCNSGVKFGGRTLAEWLDTTYLSSPEAQMEFVRSLGNATYWVQKGNSKQSRLVRELSWGGRMFGSFTNLEVDVVKAWIESLKNEPQLYWHFSGRPTPPVDEILPPGNILMDYPVFSPIPVLDVCAPQLGILHPSSVHTSSLNIGANVDVTKLLPLWFTHPCLLQSLVSIPFKSMTIARCAVLRFLRAQAGFDIESAGIAGMDEARRTDVVGILELGVEMARQAGLTVPQSLKEALEEWPSDFAVAMLHLSMRPNKNSGLLLGLS